MFFKKKPAVPQASQFEGIPFTKNHPFLQSLKLVTSVSTFPKLSKWFQTHAGCSQCFEYYVYPQDINEEYQNFRRFAISSQISAGISIIANLEKAATFKIDECSPVLTQHPFPQLNHLGQVHKSWMQVRQLDHLTQLLKYEQSQYVKSALKSEILKIASIISLLSSSDAIPANFIPYVSFDSFETDPDMIRTTDSQSKTIQSKITLMQNRCQTAYNFMQSFVSIGDPSVADELQRQKAVLLMILDAYRKNFDEQYSCIKQPCDCIQMEDFLYHPSCIFTQLMQQYVMQKTPRSYLQLINGLISGFGITELEEKRLLIAACSNVIPVLSFPLVPCDGLGSNDTKWVVDDLPFFFNTDPLLLLGMFDDRIKKQNEPIRSLARSIQALTCSWKAILQYVVDYTDFDCLPARSIEVRSEICEFLSK